MKEIFEATGWPLGATAVLWALALLPGAIVVHHALYLYFPRRQQFKMSLIGASNPGVSKRLEELYFGWISIVVRYVLPALMVVALCALTLASLIMPAVYMPWLVPATPAQGGVGYDLATAVQVLRGARFAFVGAYISVILMLTQRAFRRDVSSGIALWSGALLVVGPLAGGACALLIASGVGNGDPSFTRDAIFFATGMLPRQFTALLRDRVRRWMQPAATAIATRALPVALLRGVTPAVEERLAEEGIEDVAMLAYAQPFQLMRVTSFDARQIVQWIDEALLISTLPDYWQALEKAGVTGAMDLAWLTGDEPGRLAAAADAKIDAPLLLSAARRLAEDAQVRDLYALYWSEFDDNRPLVMRRVPDPAGAANADAIEIRRFRIQPNASYADLERLAQSLTAGGFHIELGEMFTVSEPPATLAAVEAALSTYPDVKSLVDLDGTSSHEAPPI